MKILREIPEQKEIFKELSDPEDFVYKYINLYEKQLSCSTKVFLHQIPYYQSFAAKFSEKIHSEAKSAEFEDFVFEELESALLNFKERKFYDQEFYKLCTSVLLKGYNTVAERVAEEILRFQFSNVGLLYRYTCLDIDLNRLLVSKINSKITDSQQLVDEILQVRDEIELINSKLDKTVQSTLVLEIASIQKMAGVPTDPSSIAYESTNWMTLQGDIRIPLILIGTSRRLRYAIHDILGDVLTYFIQSHQSESTDDFFLNIMNLCGELGTFDGFSNEVEMLKKVAQERILNDEGK